MLDLTLMLYFLLFIFELILLFFLSKKLVNCLAEIIYRITKNHHAVVNILAVIFLPGTIIHELAHLLFAGMMLVPVGEINVLPEIMEKGVRLGSAQIGKTDPLRRSIVGMAPVLLGMILIFSIFLFVRIGEMPVPWWQAVLALYLVFEIGNTMFSSRKDIEGVIGFIVAVMVVATAVLIALYFLNPETAQKAWLYLSGLNLQFAVSFFKSADLYLMVPLVLDLGVILPAKLIF